MFRNRDKKISISDRTLKFSEISLKNAYFDTREVYILSREFTPRHLIKPSDSNCLNNFLIAEIRILYLRANSLAVKSLYFGRASRISCSMGFGMNGSRILILISATFPYFFLSFFEASM